MSAVRRVVPIVGVSDIAASAAAYRDVLGLVEVMNHGWIATFADPDGRHQVSLLTRDATAAVDPQLSVEVDDVDAAHHRALAAGFEIVHPLTDEDWGVRRFFFRDTGGTAVNVLSHPPGTLDG